MRTLVGSLGELGPGRHTVKIKDLDLSSWAGNRLAVSFEDSTGTVHHQTIFTTKRDSTDPSIQFTDFINAALPYDDAVSQLETEYSKKDIGEAVLTGLRNCVLNITLAQSSGYTLARGDRGFAIQDVDSKSIWTDDKDQVMVFNTVRAARDYAKSQQLKPSYINVTKYEATDNDNRNQEIFNSSLSGINAAAQALGNTRLLFNPSALRKAT